MVPAAPLPQAHPSAAQSKPNGSRQPFSTALVPTSTPTAAATGELAPAGALIPEAIFEQHHQVLSRWGSKPGAITFNNVDRETANTSLYARLEALAAAGHDPADIVIAVTETISECALMSFEDSRGKSQGAAAGARYMNKALNTKIEVLTLARIKRGTEVKIADRRVAAYDSAVASGVARRAANGTVKPKAAVDPIEAARERGASPQVLDLFRRPVLERYANTKPEKATNWCLIVAGLLAGTPEEVLAWAAKSIREQCPGSFVPEPPDIKAGIEKYLELKAKRGERFRTDHVLPPWVPSTMTDRLKVYAEQREDDDEAPLVPGLARRGGMGQREKVGDPAPDAVIG